MKAGWQKIAKGAAWLCTVWLVLFGIATTPSFASVVFYVAALMLLPVQVWQNILEKYLPHFRKYKVLGVIALFFAAVLITPDSPDAAEPVESEVQSAVTAESVTDRSVTDM